MPLQTPKFWYQKPGLLALLLTPVSWFYRLSTKIDQYFNKKTSYKSSIPVICVGNAIAGGGGKTPTAIALINLIKEEKIVQNPMFLTRGYGGSTKDPVLVDIEKHNIATVGDEALLLVRHAPTIVSSDRKAGIQLAEKNGADLVIMDDGMQNHQLHKNITFLVIDRQIDFGNNKILPAGPLREPIKSVLSKTDAIICIGRPFHSDLPVFESTINPSNTLSPDKKYIAFAGLALPDKFKNTLLDLNINLIDWHPFPDHHPYSSSDIEKLKYQAEQENAILVTTEKDHARLSAEVKNDILALPITLEINDKLGLASFIREQLK